MARLKVKYTEEVAPALMKKFGYKSVMQIPKIDKIVVNVGCGEAQGKRQGPRRRLQGPRQITGQKAIATIAKKSVANFKLREGMHVGVKVTLRGDDVGVPGPSVQRGSAPCARLPRHQRQRLRRPRQLCLGIKEQLIFPEIEYDKIDKIRGMDIVIVTTAKTDEEARELLKLMGAPFVTKDKEERQMAKKSMILKQQAPCEVLHP